jgi:lysophospholipase L1-like esterase
MFAATLVAVLAGSANSWAQDPPAEHKPTPKIYIGDTFDLLKQAKRIVFLGDSITASGGYVSYFDAWLRLQNLPQNPIVINCGLPSETVSGLSEEGHAGGKFPRPDLFERLDRVLAVTKPDLVLACYGMNCGIYQPRDEERFSRYRQGIERLKNKVEAAGAKIVFITPPFYDDHRKPLPFSYNGVLDKYSNWLLSRNGPGSRVVDLHTPMTEEVAVRRKSDPDFTFQPDGVHPNDAGHWFIAWELIWWFGERSGGRDAEPRQMVNGSRPRNSPLDTDAEQTAYLDLAKKRTAVLRDAYVAAAGHKRPGVAQGLPLEEAEKKYQEYSAEIDKLLAAPPAKP